MSSSQCLLRLRGEEGRLPCVSLCKTNLQLNTEVFYHSRRAMLRECEDTGIFISYSFLMMLIRMIQCIFEKIIVSKVTLKLKSTKRICIWVHLCVFVFEYGYGRTYVRARVCVRALVSEKTEPKRFCPLHLHYHKTLLGFLEGCCILFFFFFLRGATLIYILLYRS